MANIYTTDATTLYSLDCATGSARKIGGHGVIPMTDITFIGCDGMYGITYTDFYKIDLNTGAATLVGPIGGAFGQVIALEVASDGTVYAACFTAGVGQLLTIDPTTGAGTLIGNYGGGIIPSGDLAFDTNGVLYASVKTGGIPGVEELATIDPLTGAATVIGPIGFKDVFGIDFYCCHLFGVTAGGEYLVINPNSGAGTRIGFNSINMQGMSARSCCGC